MSYQFGKQVELPELGSSYRFGKLVGLPELGSSYRFRKCVASRATNVGAKNFAK